MTVRCCGALWEDQEFFHHKACENHDHHPEKLFESGLPQWVSEGHNWYSHCVNCAVSATGKCADYFEQEGDPSEW